MKAKTKTSFYESPLVLEEVLNIEQGFAQSPYGETNSAGKTVVEDPNFTYDL